MLLLGVIIGLIFNYGFNYSSYSVQSFFGLQPNVFYGFLLPPIIFAGTINIQQFHFFKHIITILALAVFGTLISTAVVFLGIWGLGQLSWCPVLTVSEALAFAGLISATDPVASLAVFGTIGVSERLFVIVVGESILNDAAGIVIFETASHFILYQEGRSKDSLGKTIGGSIAEMFLNSIVSIIVGITVGILWSFVMKIVSFLTKGHDIISSVLFWLLGYIAFVFGNTFFMSGIIIQTFCVITLRHYGFYNLTIGSRKCVIWLAEQLAIVAETVIYIQIGVDLVTEHSTYSLLIPITIATMYLGRAISLCTLLPPSNAYHKVKQLKQGKSESKRIVPIREMIAIWHVGLRGAVALSLALSFPGERRELIKTTTIVVIAYTIYIHGISCAGVLEFLGLVERVGHKKVKRIMRWVPLLVSTRKTSRDTTNKDSQAEPSQEGSSSSSEFHQEPSHTDHHKEAVVAKRKGILAKILWLDSTYIRRFLTTETWKLKTGANNHGEERRGSGSPRSREEHIDDDDLEDVVTVPGYGY